MSHVDQHMNSQMNRLASFEALLSAYSKYIIIAHVNIKRHGIISIERMVVPKNKKINYGGFVTSVYNISKSKGGGHSS